MAPVTIVVPTNVAGIVARRHLPAGLDDGQPGVAALNISRVPAGAVAPAVGEAPTKEERFIWHS